MTRSAGRWRPLLTMLERVPEHVTSFVSGHWGTLTSIVLLMFAGIVFLSDRGASLSVVLENLLTALALVLLFLLQRSQTKSMLSLHMKLNELLRALEEPDNHLINIERLTEDELRELHARYEKLQAPEPAAPEVNIRMPRAD